MELDMNVELSDTTLDLGEEIIIAVSKIVTPQQGYNAFRYVLIDMTIEMNAMFSGSDSAEEIKSSKESMEAVKKTIDLDAETGEACKVIVGFMSGKLTPFESIGLLGFIIDMMLRGGDTNSESESETIH